MGSRRRRRPAHADPAKEYATNNPELTFAERSLAAIEANERQPGVFAPGWVYYVAVDDLIKVGFTKNVIERMRQYPPNAKLLAVEPGTRRVERERHGLLSAQLAKGREWFHDSPEVRRWVDRVLAEFGSPENFEHLWTEPTRSKQQTRLKRRGYAL